MFTYDTTMNALNENRYNSSYNNKAKIRREKRNFRLRQSEGFKSQAEIDLNSGYETFKNI